MANDWAYRTVWALVLSHADRVSKSRAMTSNVTCSITTSPPTISTRRLVPTSTIYANVAGMRRCARRWMGFSERKHPHRQQGLSSCLYQGSRRQRGSQRCGMRVEPPKPPKRHAQHKPRRRLLVAQSPRRHRRRQEATAVGACHILVRQSHSIRQNAHPNRHKALWD